MLELLQDEAVQQTLNQSILLAALVTARLIPIVQLAPYLGGEAVPQTVKMGLAMALAVLVYPAVWLSGAAYELPEMPLHIMALVVKEVLIGCLIGYVAALVFEAVRIAGQLIDNSAGITQATSMAPQLPERVSLSSNFLFQLTVVLFFVAGGHLIFLRALVLSYQLIPPQFFPLMGDEGWTMLTYGVVRMTADTITLGVLLSFPVVAAILLVNLFLALVNKSAPQINVFFLGMPIKALMGVIVILLGLDALLVRFLDESSENFADLINLIQFLGGG